MKKCKDCEAWQSRFSDRVTRDTATIADLTHQLRISEVELREVMRMRDARELGLATLGRSISNLQNELRMVGFYA